ncbi:hypothetical protein RugamoR64_25580 [Duganella rhizosphaerae]
MNSAPATTAAASPPRTIQCDQPRDSNSMTAPIKPVSATMASSWPARSSERCGSRPARAGTTRQVSQKPTTQIGILTQKMLRQPATDSSRPPSTGPAAIDMPPEAVHQAIALASMALSSA